MYAKIKYMLCIFLTVLLFCSCRTTNSNSLNNVDFILDWIPNTNHTGIYVADKMGYFEEEGIKISIKQPPEDGTAAIVASGKAQFGIDFQDSLALAFSQDEPMPITAVAAVLQHNTSGIISLKNKNITRPSELENKRYSLWNGPIESPILKYVVEKDNGDFNKVKLVPNTVFDVVSGLSSDIDVMWIYYNWDGIAAEVKGIETNFFYFKDVDPVLDYYTPVIIANSDYIRENSDIAKGFLRAVSKGYEYCIDNPCEAAEILLQEVPELDRDITIKSQKWVSKQYKFDSPKWGYIDSERWNRFYKWLYYNSLITSEIGDDFGFTNSYLP